MVWTFFPFPWYAFFGWKDCILLLIFFWVWRDCWKWICKMFSCFVWFLLRAWRCCSSELGGVFFSCHIVTCCSLQLLKLQIPQKVNFIFFPPANSQLDFYMNVIMIALTKWSCDTCSLRLLKWVEICVLKLYN